MSCITPRGGLCCTFLTILLAGSSVGLAQVPLPESAALPRSGSSIPGFTVKSVQAPMNPLLPNNSLRAVRQITGTSVILPMEGPAMYYRLRR